MYYVRVESMAIFSPYFSGCCERARQSVAAACSGWCSRLQLDAAVVAVGVGVDVVTGIETGTITGTGMGMVMEANNENDAASLRIRC